MARCQKCNRDISEKGAFCPYCGFRNAAPPKPNNHRVKIALILAVTAVVVAGIVLGCIVLAHHLSRKKTFNLTAAQYTAQVNRELGEDLLHESKWVVNGAHVVYSGDGFTIDLDTDLDTQMIQKISITPPEHPTAQRIMTVTVTIVHTEVTVVNNYYVFEPEPKPDKTTAPSSVPTTTMPSTAYTAEDLLELSLDEIIELMGGDFTCSFDNDSYGFVRSGFGSSGVVWIYNEEKLPGFAFHPDINMQSNADLNELKVNLKKGGYSYNGISMKGSAKYNNALSADMCYNDLTQQFGTFDIHTAAQENYLYSADLGGNRISFFFRPGDDLRSHLKDNKVLSTDMQQLNPQLESIEVRIEGGEGGRTGTAPAAANTKWKQLYTDYINSNYTKLSQHATPRYALAGITDDEIPELIILSNNARSMVENYAYLVWVNDEQLLSEENVTVAKYKEKGNTFYSDSIIHGRHLASHTIDKSTVTTMHTTDDYTKKLVDSQPADDAAYASASAEIMQYGDVEPVYTDKEDILRQIASY